MLIYRWGGTVSIAKIAYEEIDHLFHTSDAYEYCPTCTDRLPFRWTATSHYSSYRHVTSLSVTGNFEYVAF